MLKLMYIRTKHLLLSRVFHSSTLDNLVTNSHSLLLEENLCPSFARASRGLCTFSSPGLFCIALPPHPLLGRCMDVNYLLFHVWTTSLPAWDLSHMQTLSLFFLPLVNFPSAEVKPQLKFHFLKVCLPWHSKAMPELSDTVCSFEQLLPLTYLYVWFLDWSLSHTLQSVSLYSRLQPIMGYAISLKNYDKPF